MNWLIFFEDADRRPEIYTDERAARARLDHVQGAGWNCHLFAEAPSRDAPAVPDGPFGLALNVKHQNCHQAADAFWKYWNENGETHKRGYYESTWGAINQAIKLVGVVPWTYGGTIPAAAPNPDDKRGSE